MYARIVGGRVAELTEAKPITAPGECALIVEVGAEVKVGWAWSPGGCSGPTLAQAKTAKMGAILAAAGDFLGQRCCGYTEMEKVSWEQQAREAAELATDPDAAAPLVRAIAAARGMTVAALAQRIQDNAATWTALSGYAVGRKGALLDALSAAETVPAVEAVDVSFTTPAGLESAKILFQS